jgi:hypothetical protein
MINSHYLKCPFCMNHSVVDKPGKTTCPGCGAEFEIDDRMGCIFADTQRLRLPVNGTVCRVCGLVQSNKSGNCLYCGSELNTRLQ